MKLLLKYSLLFILTFASFGFDKVQGFDPNAKMKAVFIYNFTRYFEWPEKMKNGNFIIQVIGTNNNLNVELNKMASVKQVGNQKLEIKSSIDIEPSLSPHIIFLLTESSDMLKEVASKYKGKGTLILTEKTGLAKTGAAINFVVVDNKQKFEFNKNNAVKAGLVVNNELQKLAIAVE